MTFFAVDKREFCWEHRSLQHPDATSFPTRRRRSRQEIPRALRQMGGKGRSLLLAATVVFLLHAPLLVSCTDLDAHIYKGCANHIFCGGALPPTVAVLSSGLSLHVGSTKFYKTTTRPRWAPPPRSSSYCSVAGTCPAPIAPPASPAPCRHGATYPTPPFAAFLPSPSFPPRPSLCSPTGAPPPPLPRASAVHGCHGRAPLRARRRRIRRIHGRLGPAAAGGAGCGGHGGPRPSPFLLRWAWRRWLLRLLYFLRLAPCRVADTHVFTIFLYNNLCRLSNEHNAAKHHCFVVFKHN